MTKFKGVISPSKEHPIRLRGDLLAGELDELLRHFRPDPALSFMGGSADMRRANDVIQFDQFPVGGRLLGIYIQCCSSDLATRQCFIKISFVNNPAACAVNDADAGLHL